VVIHWRIRCVQLRVGEAEVVEPDQAPGLSTP
jgi:hypothetical protein